ncbi:hypothetical protein B0H13DRAFT_2352763 [Mycena leptocephala]|nr:hypothetical protein B0H13DRAFT_2352763 [Mycena leptocephala]
MHIEVCFILHFDLLWSPQLGKPFMACIDLGVEPAHMPNFFSLFMNDSMDTRQARENVERVGFEANSLGLTEFGNGASQQSITCPAHITQAVMDLVHESPPWVRTSAIAGRSPEAPFNIETCMEYCVPSLDFSCPQILKAKTLREDIIRPLMVWPAGNPSWGPFA